MIIDKSKWENSDPENKLKLCKMISEMPTHNGTNKDDFVLMLRFLLVARNPQEVIYIDDGEELHCPSCENDLMGCGPTDNEKPILFCPFCGQALSWE